MHVKRNLAACGHRESYRWSVLQNSYSFLPQWLCFLKYCCTHYGHKTRVSKQMLALLVVEVITLALSSSWAALSSCCDLPIDKQHLTVLMGCSRKSVLMPPERELAPDSNVAHLSACHLWAVFQGSPKVGPIPHDILGIGVSHSLCWLVGKKTKQQYSICYFGNCVPRNLSWNLCQVSETYYIILTMQLIAGNSHKIIWSVQSKRGPYGMIIKRVS